MSNTPQTDWHAITAEQAVSGLKSTPTGLSDSEAVERLQRVGPNELRPPKVRSPLARLLSQFHNVLIYVLLGAGVVTLALGHHIDAAVILAVVVINALIGFVQ